MPSRALTLGLLAAATLAGCGGGDDPPATSASTAARPAAPPAKARPRPPAICGPVTVSRTGTVQAAEAVELSGLAVSVAQPGVLWAHNDSGDRARVFALRRDGALLASVDVGGAQAVDWEDLALARGRLYLADIGDNGAQRPAVDVYRVREPGVLGGAAPASTEPAERFRLRYPDGAHDAETLLVEPRTGELAIVTKRLSGDSGVYVARRPAPGATTTLRHVADLELGLGGLATGGDVSADGRVVAVRTYSTVVAWAKRPGETLASTLRRRPCRGRADLGGEGQGEALALSRGGRAFYTVPEGAGAAIRRYVAR
jgi:hypothetical protein